MRRRRRPSRRRRRRPRRGSSEPSNRVFINFFISLPALLVSSGHVYPLEKLSQKHKVVLTRKKMGRGKGKINNKLSPATSCQGQQQFACGSVVHDLGIAASGGPQGRAWNTGKRERVLLLLLLLLLLLHSGQVPSRQPSLHGGGWWRPGLLELQALVVELWLKGRESGGEAGKLVGRGRP